MRKDKKKIENKVKDLGKEIERLKTELQQATEEEWNVERADIYTKLRGQIGKTMQINDLVSCDGADTDRMLDEFFKGILIAHDKGGYWNSNEENNIDTVSLYTRIDGHSVNMSFSFRTLVTLNGFNVRDYDPTESKSN